MPRRTRWDEGLEWIRINGPFETGATGEVKVTGDGRGATMVWVDEQTWYPVDRLDPGTAEPDPLRVLDRVGGTRASRYRSDAGHRAVLLPVSALKTGSRSPVSLTGSLRDVGELLFVDPASAGTAVSLLSALGEPRSIRVALPMGTNPAELVPAGGQVHVETGPGQVDYALFGLGRRTPADRDRLAAAPKMGESADVLNRRSRWFESREGRT